MFAHQLMQKTTKIHGDCYLIISLNFLYKHVNEFDLCEPFLSSKKNGQIEGVYTLISQPLPISRNKFI